MNEPHPQPRVGLDCLALLGRPTGAGLYIRQLACSLLNQRNRPFQLIIFCKPHHVGLFAPWLQPGDRLCPVPILNRLHLLFTYEWLVPMLLVRYHIQLFHATHYLAPPVPRGVPLALTIHDLGLFLHPHRYSLGRRLYLRTRLPVFLRRARRIIAISHTTARHLKAFFPQQASKIHVIYHGTDHLPETAPLAVHSRTARPPFLLAVNAFESRKNMPFLIEVFEHLKQRYRMPHRLVLAGYPANGLAEVAARCHRSPVASAIELCIQPDEEELLSLYHRADAFLSASLLEGFGFTPLEALRCGRPVFLYANDTVRELFPPSPALFNHLDAALWAEQIFRQWLAGFPQQPDRAFLQSLSWQQCARETMELYHTCFALREEPLHVA